MEIFERESKPGVPEPQTFYPKYAMPQPTLPSPNPVVTSVCFSDTPILSVEDKCFIFV